MAALGPNDFDVLEVDMGYSTPCHIPLTRAGVPHCLNDDGYSKVRRSVNGKAVNVLAHRARYEAVHGKLEPGLVPDHLCKHRPCCNPAHMEAVTIAENNRRGRSAKLTPEAVLKLRAMRAAGMTCKAIGDALGVSQSVVSRTSRGENWADGLSPAWQAVKNRRLEA